MNKKILMVGTLALLLTACGGNKPAPHEHNWSSTWTSDATYHWKTCDGCEEISDKGEHDFQETGRTLREDKSCYDVSYACSVCGETSTGTDDYTLTKEDILEKLASAKTKSASAASSIKSGEYSFTSYGNTTTGSFEYGTHDNKPAFKQSVTNTSSSTTSYVYYDGDDACGYKIDNKTEAVSKYGYAAPTENDFKGVKFTSGFFNVPYNANVYGVDDIFTIAYNTFVADSNKDLVVSYSDNTYTYNCGAVIEQYGNKNYYRLSGSVTFDEVGIISSYTAKYAQYQVAQVVVDDELGTFQPVEGVSVNETTFSYTATSGTREEMTLPYTYNDFKFTSFGLSYGGTKVEAGSTVEVELSSTSASFALVDKAPASASADFDAFTFTIKDVDTNAPVSGFSSYYNNTFNITAAVGKTYDVTISTASGASFNFKMKGKAPNPTAINAFFAIVNAEGKIMTANFDSKVYIGKPVNITATANPTTADQGYTLTCKDSSNNTIELPKHTGTMQTNSKVLDYYTFDMTVAGTYTLEFVSTAKSDVKLTKTIEVCEAPSIDGIFKGDYYTFNTRGGSIIDKFTFTPDTTTDAVDGTLTVINNPSSSMAKTSTFTYTLNADGDGVDCTKVSGDCNYFSIRFVTTSSYSVNAWIRYSETDTEQQMGLYTPEQIKNFGVPLV